MPSSPATSSDVNTDYDETPLFRAAENGDLDAVNVLLRAGADINKATAYGETPLTIATRKDHLSVVTALLNADANINQACSDGATPLFLAARKGHLRVVTLLIHKGADKEQASISDMTPLCIAARQGQLAVVTKLLHEGAYKDKARRDGATPLCLAAREGHPKVVAALLHAGADKDKAMNDGTTPLRIAAEYGRHKVVVALSITAAMTLVKFRAYLSKLDDTDISLNLLAIMKSYQALRADSRSIGIFSQKNTCKQKADIANKIIKVMENIEPNEANETKAELPVLSLTPKQFALATEKSSDLGTMFAVFKKKYNGQYNLSILKTIAREIEMTPLGRT
jgi:ankyrin repeat protein